MNRYEAAAGVDLVQQRTGGDFEPPRHLDLVLVRIAVLPLLLAGDGSWSRQATTPLQYFPCGHVRLLAR